MPKICILDVLCIYKGLYRIRYLIKLGTINLQSSKILDPLQLLPVQNLVLKNIKKNQFGTCHKV